MTPFKVVATVLYGANDDDKILDAIRSVYDIVDHVLVIDTAGRVLEERSSFGTKSIDAQFHWTGNASDARNFALDEATKYGDWAMTLDTDERVQLGSVEHLQAELQAAHEAHAAIVYVNYQGGEHMKERFIRLPAFTEWVGPAHEAYYPGHHPTYIAKGMDYTELPKTPEQSKARLERDRMVLENYLVDHPTEPRWWFYLGESFFRLGQYLAAIDAYKRCAALRGWDEEAAWACYRAAEAHLELGEREEALDCCALGLARHAGMAELAWLAGWICLQLGRHQQAVYWAKLAEVHGYFLGDGKSIRRIGFRHLPGLWEGPYDVLYWAEQSWGHEDKAAKYLNLCATATSVRGDQELLGKFK